MLQRLRLALQEEYAGKFGGEVEIDETFIGGKARNMHKSVRERRIKGSGPEGKEIVMGMMERGGKVRTIHVEKRTKKELQAQVKEHVQAGSATAPMRPISPDASLLAAHST